uniref:Protein kinase domain-containing protein n=1 Tax=Quercus lobata TaxID=97700 RepID=A0A7N2LR11_QUELO
MLIETKRRLTILRCLYSYLDLLENVNQSFSVLPCRRFSLAEMKTATNNFDDNLVIGEGRYGKVYQGFIDDRSISVAIKVHGQWNYGNLARHLYATNPDHDPVPWKRRLQICVDVARGLHCLQTGLKHTIIHRDVKPTNILLNEKWEAKLSDFGLSKMGPPSLSKALTRIETNRIVGTYGYMAPEYAVNGVLTDKSDVYSFGVVLLQLLSGRKPSELVEQMNLVSWARKCKQEGTINEIIDPYLMGKIAPVCFMVRLEHALELQDSADSATGDCNYCFDEYTCNASSGDASPIDTWWKTASGSNTSAEELSLDTAMANGQI